MSEKDVLALKRRVRQGERHFLAVQKGRIDRIEADMKAMMALIETVLHEMDSLKPILGTSPNLDTSTAGSVIDMASGTVTNIVK